MILRIPPTEPAPDQMLEFEDWLVNRVEALREGGEPPRAKVLLRAIIAEGEVSTGEMEKKYKHPPSAKRDARNLGFLVETKRRTIDGKSQGVYYLSKAMTQDRVAGAIRKGFPEKFRKDLLDHYGDNCMICRMASEDRSSKKLQPDHRIPFDIAGDASMVVSEFIPLCGSCNRAKSWTCEHCPNWLIRDITVCHTCYWAIPEQHYQHVATKPERRLSLVWEHDAVSFYDTLRQKVESEGQSMQEAVFELLMRS